MGRGGVSAGAGAELHAVAVRVCDEGKGLAVVADTLSQHFVAVLPENFLGSLEVLHLEGVMHIAGLCGGLGSLDKVHHNPVFQLQPGNRRVVNLALNL